MGNINERRRVPLDKCECNACQEARSAINRAAADQDRTTYGGLAGLLMTPDEKNAAHRLLFDQKAVLDRLRRNSGAPEMQLAVTCLLTIIDILELQIRRIDELEHL